MPTLVSGTSSSITPCKSLCESGCIRADNVRLQSAEQVFLRSEAWPAEKREREHTSDRTSIDELMVYGLQEKSQPRGYRYAKAIALGEWLV